MEPNSGDPILTFVVVADTHVNEDEHTSSSPFETNHQANSRARHVFAEIAAMDPSPAFVIHLGDIVHPVPSLPGYQPAVENFNAIAKPLSVPLHVIPGNHDVGDKTIDWMPADQVCDDYLDTYRAAFGEDFYAFDHGECRFVLLNSLLLNSGLDDEVRQREWLEAQLASAGEQRVFLFMHYPPFIYSADERGNYDNIDQPGRTWLIEQIRHPSVEAAFAGHVHNFWYERIDEAELYMLPSTAFLRHDFSEFGKTTPGAEFGRADVEKFGYFRVDVFASGHVAYSVRSGGKRLLPGGTPDVRPDPLLNHPRTSTFVNAGVELRHPWAEVMQITATGGVQEFGRKWARNDYPLLALWEMGARLVKIPDVDVLEEGPRRRLALASRMRQSAIVTVLGAPRAPLLEALVDCPGVCALELNLTLAGFERKRGSIAETRADTGLPVYLAKILTDTEAHFDGKTFSHFVKSGFTVEELARHREMIASAREAGELDGVSVRIEVDEDLVAAGAVMAAFAAQTGTTLLASLKLAGSGLATLRDDDFETALRAAQALVLSRCGDSVRYVFDTFMDVDRGYYPRHAFIDRRFNPRPAARVFTAMGARFRDDGAFQVRRSKPGALEFDAGGQRWCLLNGTPAELLALTADVPGIGEVTDLLEGAMVDWGAIVAGEVDARRLLLSELPD